MLAGDEEGARGAVPAAQPGRLSICAADVALKRWPRMHAGSFHGFDSRASRFRSGARLVECFLLGVARNHVLRRLRRERFYVAIEADSENHGETIQAAPTAATSAGPLDHLTRTEAIESVRRSVLALPERYREVVVLAICRK